MPKSNQRQNRSSSQWRQMQENDGFVREAARLGVRSRSYFKIEEIDRRFELFKQGQTVLDLGASPGGWSQYASSRIGSQGRVIAIDLLDMQPLNQVCFMQCDITQQQAVDELTSAFGERQVNVVLSDMAPNITGNSTIDSRNFSEIHEAIFNVCRTAMAEQGSLVFKFFQDNESSVLREVCAAQFADCKLYKPKASRSKSQEAYMIAKGFKG